MKIDTRDVKPLVKKPKPREPKDKPRKKSDFELACEEANKNPGTVRRRMAPKHQRGQGMTLEEALSTPVKTRQQCGTQARRKTNWGTYDGDRS